MRRRFNPWVGKIPWRRAWQPAPVFLPGESNGQRSLVGYIPGVRKESDTAKYIHRYIHCSLKEKQPHRFHKFGVSG